jgi:hypothetical protein
MAAPKTGPTAKKRPEDRLGHRTKAEQAKMDEIIVSEDEIEALKSSLTTDLTPAEYWHPVALRGWLSFCESPLSRFYEDTDYVQAWVTCELIHRSLKDGMSPGRAMQLRIYMNDLGFTEGARRQMDIAIKRETEKADPAKVVAKERLEARRASRGA